MFFVSWDVSVQKPAHLHTACVLCAACPIAWCRRGRNRCYCGDLWLPWATAELFWFLLPRANICSPLLCALLILLVVNLLLSHPWASSLVLTAQTFRHTGAAVKGTGVRAWGVMWGHGFPHPMAGPLHHVGSINSPSPLSPYSTSSFPGPSWGLPEQPNITAMLLIPHSGYETRCHDLLSLTQVCM